MTTVAAEPNTAAPMITADSLKLSCSAPNGSR
jgi:hypothetical protein